MVSFNVLIVGRKLDKTIIVATARSGEFYDEAEFEVEKVEELRKYLHELVDRIVEDIVDSLSRE